MSHNLVANFTTASSPILFNQPQLFEATKPKTLSTIQNRSARRTNGYTSHS